MKNIITRRPKRNLKNILLIFTCIILLPLSSFAGKTPEIKGVYNEIPGQEFSFKGKQVEIIEFLSMYCGHCYHFEKAIPVIKGNFPGKIKWTTIPIYWGNGSPKPSEAYFLALDAGKGEQMKKAIFHAIFVEKRDIGQIDVLEEIGLKVGMGFDFSMRLRAGEKSKEVGEALLLANKYGIQETPSLIIAGNLKVTPGMFIGLEAYRDNVIIMLKDILKNK